MIEHTFTWTCDYPGCKTEQQAEVWTVDSSRPSGLGPMEGWLTLEKDGEARHYCRECAARLEETDED